jgi:hypothetical protein
MASRSRGRQSCSMRRLLAGAGQERLDAENFGRLDGFAGVHLAAETFIYRHAVRRWPEKGPCQCPLRVGWESPQALCALCRSAKSHKSAVWNASAVRNRTRTGPHQLQGDRKTQTIRSGAVLKLGASGCGLTGYRVQTPVDMARRHFTQFGTNLSAFLRCDRTAGVEVTPARRREGRGNFALDRQKFPPL